MMRRITVVICIAMAAALTTLGARPARGDCCDCVATLGTQMIPGCATDVSGMRYDWD